MIFVLATTEVHKIPETILSRCQQFEFRRIPLEALIGRLETIAARKASGQARSSRADCPGSDRQHADAISLFDQLSAGDAITADYVRLMLGAERREVIRSLLSSWVDRDLSGGLSVINRAIDGALTHVSWPGRPPISFAGCCSSVWARARPGMIRRPRSARSSTRWPRRPIRDRLVAAVRYSAT